MKPMNENFLIRIDGTMEQSHQGEADHVQLLTRGSFLQKDGSFYITYKESEATGYEGCTTTLKIAGDGHRVALLRFAAQAQPAASSRRARRHVCHYETGYGRPDPGGGGGRDLPAASPRRAGAARFSYTLDAGNEESCWPATEWLSPSTPVSLCAQADLLLYEF